MRENLRKSGVDIIGDISWGTHLCQFYQTKEDLSDILVSYFKAGLENNEFCIWITAQSLEVEEAKEALKKAVPYFDTYLEKGQIEIIPSSHMYLSEDVSDSDRILNGWVEKLNRALANGYEGLRLSENTFWLEKEDWNDFSDYEKKIDRVICNYKMIALCTYSLEKFSAIEIIDVIVNHQFALIKRDGKWEQIESSRRKIAEETAIPPSSQREKVEQELERAKEMMCASEEKYREIFNSMGEAIQLCELVLDEEGRPVDNIILDVNPAYEKHSGIRREQIVGRRIKEVLPIVEQVWLDRYGEVVRKGLEMHFEEYNSSLDKWFKVFASPISGNRFAVVFTDITERKEAEEAIYQSEQHYRLLFETMNQGVVYQAADGKIISMNPAAERILGKTAAEFLGSSSEGEEHDTIREDGSPFPGVEHPAMVSLKTGLEVQDVVMGVYNPRENCYRWINVNSVPIIRPGEDKPSQVYALFNDITKSKRAEEILRESEIKYHLLFENMLEGFAYCRMLYDDCGCPVDFIYLDTNSAFERLTGLKEVTGKRVTEAIPEIKELHPELFDAYSRVALTGRSERFEIEFKPLGIWLWISVYSTEREHFVAVFDNITERKKTEEAIKKAHDILEEKIKERTAELEEAYESLLENDIRLNEAQKTAHLGNWDWNPLTDELYWSDEMYRIFEVDPLKSVLTHDAFLSYVHPDDRDYVDNAIKEGLSGKPREIDYRIILADRGERIVHAQGEVIFDEKHIPVRVKGTVQDINERKLIEKMLKESEGKLKALFNVLPVGISITDKERNILDVNLALENILGLSRSDLLNGNCPARKYLRSNGTEMPAEEFPSIRALKNKGKIQSSEVGIIKEDGNTIWTDVSAVSLPFSNEQVVITTRDITKNKKAEEKIQNLANIVESSNDAIITTSLDGIITSWNKGAEQTYGYLAKKIMGKPISILDPPISVGETKELAELIIQGDRIHHYETLRLRKDGKIINVSLTLSPIFDASEQLTAISVIARDITKSKKAEEKLKKNEERYRIVTVQTGQVVYDYDLRTNESRWAGAVEEVTGYSFEELHKFGKDFWIKNIHRADQNHADEDFQNVRTTGGRFKEELRLRRKDGTCIYIENSGICLTDHEGLPYGAMGVLKDITSARNAENQLQENEERYRIATEQTGQVIFDFNLKTGEIRLTGALWEVTGYDPEELENLDKSILIEHVHPEDRMEMLGALRKSLKEEKKFQVEFRFRKKDGSYIYAENYGVWLKDDSGKVYRAIGVIKNITGWKLAIEKVAESEKKYRSFIQNFHGIAFQADEDFVPVFLHGAVKEITGYSEKEFMSRIKWKDIIHPDDLSFVLKEEEKIRSSSSAVYEGIEFRIKHRDGRIRWVNEIYQKIQIEGGKPEFYQGTIYDVTERKETEKFLENIETARKKEIHHRIKNNLQVISSLLDLEAEKFDNRECVPDSEVLKAFRESQDRVISMSLIHEELYKGGGLDTLNFSSYVKELTKNLFHTYRLGNASTSLNMDLEENIFLDMDTAVPLGIIINELISNSLKHAFADRDNGRIQIKFCREESQESKDNGTGNNNEGLKGISFILIVSDNGIGVPESFDLENPDSLGIQLVTTLVDQLDGELELRRDNGTEFTIRFTTT